MKHSIRIRLTLILTILMICTIFTCWYVNKAFLTDYYQNSKVGILGKAYAQVNQIYNESKENEVSIDEINLAIEQLGANKDLNIYVMELYYSQNMGMTILLPDFIYPVYQNKMQLNQVVTRIKEFLMYEQKESSVENKDMEALKIEGNYNIFKVFDERVQSNYIELFGTLDNDNAIYIRANFESMKESVGIFNTFLAYVGIIVTIIGVILMFFISKSFTKPIQDLSGIAKRMSDLDFGVKYEVKRKDEIGDLGHSINVLSNKLEKTIMELKSVNNELKHDIAQKIQIDEMRKDFLSNVSHELKTPIALIQGYAEGLKDNINEEPEDREFYCEVIIDEASKMNKMVKKLLTLNQIEFGNNQIQFERFDIIELLSSVLNATDILFQQKNVTLHFDHCDPIYVWADEYMIEEVVTNYISNALNHVKNENIIEVKAIKKEDVVRIIVFNTGDFIQEEELDKVWIKFYKVDKARTREYGGSGIGLSIVKAIMNALNQECGVCNRDNGVEFWFELDCKMDTNTI